MNARDELLELVSLAGGFETSRHEIAEATDAILAAGFSKHRTIATVGEVAALPALSVMRTKQGYAMEKLGDEWHRAGVDYAYTPNGQWLPATVLYEPAP